MKNSVIEGYKKTKNKLRNLLKNEYNPESEEYKVICDKLVKISCIIYNGECDARDELIDRRCT